MKKSICLIYTGGTIGMEKTASGYQPAAGFLGQHLGKMPAFQHPDMPDISLHEYNPLLDSSNMTPLEWQKIAKDIFDHYDQFDGFVILHGTDTMAYTASALSFMLANLGKPVILTGSQIPLIEIRNDARDNLINSLLIANHYAIPEVCVYFNQALYRGNRVRKMSAQSYDAFGSPNFPPLAQIATEINLRTDLLLQQPTTTLELKTLDSQAVAILDLFPGIPSPVLGYLLQHPLKALVLRTFGAGNAPDNNPSLLRQLQDAIEQGILVINCTQCPNGSVEMERYATGNALHEIGVISAYDMTPESIVTKLMYLFSQPYSLDDIKTLMQTNLRGELTRL